MTRTMIVRRLPWLQWLAEPDSVLLVSNTIDSRCANERRCELSFLCALNRQCLLPMLKQRSGRDWTTAHEIKIAGAAVQRKGEWP